MSTQFAKLFERYGVQVLVKLDSSEEENRGAEIRFYCKPDSLGVCSVAMSFADTDSGWDAAELAFNRIDEEIAFNAISDVLDFANELPEED